MARVVSKAEMARICNVSAPTISSKICPGGRFEAAMIDNVIDIDHPAVKRYISERILQGAMIKYPPHIAGDPPVPLDGGPQMPPGRPSKDKKTLENKRRQAAEEQRQAAQEARQAAIIAEESRPSTAEALPSDATEYLDFTLREILEKFGTMPGFKNYLDAVKTIEEIASKRLKNEETKGALISREFVEKYIFQHIESLQVRILSDAPGTIAGRCIECVDAGYAAGQIEEEVYKILSKQLRGIKDKIDRSFENA